MELQPQRSVPGLLAVPPQLCQWRRRHVLCERRRPEDVSVLECQRVHSVRAGREGPPHLLAAGGADRCRRHYRLDHIIARHAICFIDFDYHCAHFECHYTGVSVVFDCSEAIFPRKEVCLLGTFYSLTLTAVILLFFLLLFYFIVR